MRTHVIFILMGKTQNAPLFFKDGHNLGSGQIYKMLSVTKGHFSNIESVAVHL